ncbi:MAG: biotin--[acetyl-CoA-carboxylase] ligase, partial [Jatrophihabitans endophyticus]|nr:biotin--[acetyl-CoA-carboxylase] ligase [Jatrophihabitans endophyticus]
PRCATLGHQVRVTLTGGPPLVGEAVDLDGSGRLVLDGRGRTTTVSAGDVEHVRPA